MRLLCPFDRNAFSPPIAAEYPSSCRVTYHRMPLQDSLGFLFVLVDLNKCVNYNRKYLIYNFDVLMVIFNFVGRILIYAIYVSILRKIMYEQ